MVRKIFMFNDPILKSKCEEVTEFDSDLKKVVEDMKDTMLRFKGIGLSANQIGIDKRIIIVSDLNSKEIYELVNPEIVIKSNILEEEFEGCLSYPNKRKKIKRPSSIKVVGFDVNAHIKEYTEYGYQARIFFHEIDHLNGICRVS